MRITTIFEIVKDALYSFQFEDNTMDEFHHQFTLWRDPVYLEQFIHDNAHYLQHPHFQGITPEEAIIQIKEEADFFLKRLKKALNTGRDASVLFEMLDRTDDAQHLQKQKAKATFVKNRHKWLRLYAIRVDRQLYVITGGCIKVSHRMEDHPKSEQELIKIQSGYEFLAGLGLHDREQFELWIYSE